jgi:hypothetical protein
LNVELGFFGINGGGLSFNQHSTRREPLQGDAVNVLPPHFVYFVLLKPPFRVIRHADVEQGKSTVEAAVQNVVLEA